MYIQSNFYLNYRWFWLKFEHSIDQMHYLSTIKDKRFKIAWFQLVQYCTHIHIFFYFNVDLIPALSKGAVDLIPTYLFCRLYSNIACRPSSNMACRLFFQHTCRRNSAFPTSPTKAVGSVRLLVCTETSLQKLSQKHEMFWCLLAWVSLYGVG